MIVSPNDVIQNSQSASDPLVIQNSQSASEPMAGNQSKMSDYNRSLLVELNDDMARALIPAILYLVVLMLVGSVGNFLTILIYGWRFKPTTQNCLFMWLGVVDIMSCLVGMPSEIVDLRYYFLYEDIVACKFTIGVVVCGGVISGQTSAVCMAGLEDRKETILRFLLTVPPLASANMLLVIAVDRYRRVCKPLHWQMEVCHARLGVGLAALVAVVLACPALSLYGKRTVPTSVQGISGCDCSLGDEYQGHLYPLLYEMLFGVLFLLYTLILTVLYVRAWLETRRHRQYMASHSIPPCLAYSSLLKLSADNGLDYEATAAGGGGGSASSPASASASPGISRKNSGVLNSDLVPKIRASLKANKMTVIAFAVTAVFALSYLPHLVLILLRTTIEGFDQQQTGAKLVFFNIFLRSYFVNSVANVFVYSAMNDDFRDHCRKLCSFAKRCGGNERSPPGSVGQRV